MATALTQAVYQNLECPVCLSFFKDPKILTCSHTFCKGCLETLLESLPDEQSLSCPVCRGMTPVPDGDVSKLPTSIALRSLVAEVETQGQLCANCDPRDKSLAVVYCKECGDYLCTFCKTVHLKWLRFSKHPIVPASDVLSGKILSKRRYKCQKHPTEDEECFCFTCGMYACFRCGVVEHTHDGHKITEASVHEIEQKKSIDKLVSRAEEKKDVTDQFIDRVTEERRKLQEIREKINYDISGAFEDSVRKLTERKELLKRGTDEKITELETLLADMEEESRKHISKVTAICELVKNGLAVPLQKEALTAHTTLCQELEQLLSRVEPDREQLRKTGEHGEHIGFERSIDSNGLELGQVRKMESKWIFFTQNKVPGGGYMNGMAKSPNSTISVAGDSGTIFTYSAGGHLQETVKGNVKVSRLQYFPNGRYIVRDTGNHLTLYSTQHQDLGVIFDTLNIDEGGGGGLTVDEDDNILIGYSKAKKIQVFKPEGGQAVREIPCHSFEPWQIFTMPSSNMILVSSVVSTVRMIDGISGASMHSISKSRMNVYPCVGKDDSVIIAWMKHSESYVKIELFTRNLELKKELVVDWIDRPRYYRLWGNLQMLKRDELVLCTEKNMCIFKKILE